jgi:hypothetical protein
MLTDTGIRRLAARERRFEVQDEGGLSLEIMLTKSDSCFILYLSR